MQEIELGDPLFSLTVRFPADSLLLMISDPCFASSISMLTLLMRKIVHPQQDSYAFCFSLQIVVEKKKNFSVTTS